MMTDSHYMSSIDLYDADDPMCHICHNTGGRRREALVRPCWCKGSLGSVHKSCLETWLTVTNRNTCPICNFRFHRHFTMKPLWQWKSPPTRASEKVMVILTIIIYIALLLQLAAMCLLLIQYHRHSACYTAASIGIAAVVGGLPWIVAGCIGMTVEMYYSDYWIDWRKLNRRVIVRLVNPDDIATTV